MLKELIKLFIRTNGRNPNKLELLQLKFKAAQQAGKGEVIQFPPSAITDWTKPRPTTGKKADVTELDEPLVNEFARTETLASPTRIKQGFSTQSKLNHWSQNQKQVSDFIGRKNREFNSLNAEDQKEVLEMFEKQIKKHMPKERKAGGGIAGMLGEPTYVDDNHRVPFNEGKEVERSWIKFPSVRDEKGNIVPTFSKTGKQQIEGAPEGITSDKEYINFIMSLDIPVTDKINLLGDLGYGKFRDKIEYGDDELFLQEGGGKSRKVGIGYNKEGDGFSGHIKYDIGSGKPEAFFKWSKKFNEGGRVPYDSGNMVLPKPKPFQGLFHTEVGGPVITKDDSEFEAVVDRWSQFARQQGEGPEDVKRNKSFALENIVRIGRELGYEDDEIKEIILRINKAQGGRVGFKDGSKMSRRTFLKTAAGLAALPVVGKFFKWAKPAAKVADLTSVPIKNAEGMPKWFKPLVNRVIKEGTDTTNLPIHKGGAFLDRQIVHSAKLGEGQGVRVYQNLDDQTIRVEYQSADNMGGIDDAVHLEYTAPQIIEPPVVKGGKLSGYGKGVKTKAEFKAEEAFPHGTTGDYKDITMEGSNVVTKVDDLYSDTSALKQFGTNKTLSKKELEIAKQKQKRVNEINNDLGEQSQLLPEPPDPDFASGGRVPFSKGKLALLEGLGKLMDDFFPGTTKLGKRSKPFPGKVQEKMDLRKALAGFKKREEAAKLKELKTWENPDKVRAAVDDIFSTGDYKMDAQMAAEALVENNPKAFGNKLYDDLDDRTRMKIYGAVLEVVQSDLGKMLQLKRASKPTKTLEGIKKTGTIDISDPNIAEEFTKFMKETDPKGYAKIQKVVDDANQQLELKRFKTKGRKPNAEGGLAGMLGE